MAYRLIWQALLGAALGYLLHRLTRGEGGTCMFLCSPYRAMLTGAVLGMMWPAAGGGKAASVGTDVRGLVPRGTAMSEVMTTTGKPVHVDESNFEALVTDATTPILLDAYADWCGPCRMLAPELEKVAAELDGKVVVAKLNTEESRALAAALQIRSIPALFVIDAGRVVDGWVGYATSDDIITRLRPYLK